MGAVKNAYKMLNRKPEGKRHLGRPRRRWKVNIKMDIRKIVWMLWTELPGSGQKPVMGCCEHCNGPSDYTKGKDLLD
jgi:hypothetical protein